jgi:hypothetical protein
MSLCAEDRLRLVASRLARELFMARNDAFQLDEGWQTLKPAVRAIYERHALASLRAMNPNFQVISHDQLTRS